MTGLIDFSPDAASNDVAAPPIYFGEGQAAGTLNNSAREMMAAIARWHIDTSGFAVASGAAAGALSMATQQLVKPDTLTRSFLISFLVDAQNPGPCTLNLDATGGRPLRRPGNIELAPADLQPGVPYRAAFLPGLGAFILITPNVTRPGWIGAFGSDGAIPPGWIPCDGRALSRSTHAALFSVIGGIYGVPNDATFSVPDLRGRTLFGQDAGTGRLTISGGLSGAIGSAGGAELVALSVAQLASHGHGGGTGGAGGHNHGGATGAGGGHDHGGATGGAGGHSHTGTTGSGGGHTHTGSTDSAGYHSHGVGYVRQVNYRTDGSSGGVNALDAGAGGTNTTGVTDGNGAHSHGVTVSAAGDHQHAFTTNGAGEHAHIISGVGDHGHGIAGVADHTHTLSLEATGSGQGHPNIPPGLVAVFAIKA